MGSVAPDTLSTRIARVAEVLLAGLILAALVWVGTTVTETKLAVSELRSEVYAMGVLTSERQLLAVRTLDAHEKYFDTVWPRMRELKEQTNRLAAATGHTLDWRF